METRRLGPVNVSTLHIAKTAKIIATAWRIASQNVKTSIRSTHSRQGQIGRFSKSSTSSSGQENKVWMDLSVVSFICVDMRKRVSLRPHQSTGFNIDKPHSITCCRNFSLNSFRCERWLCSFPQLTVLLPINITTMMIYWILSTVRTVALEEGS